MLENFFAAAGSQAGTPSKPPLPQALRTPQSSLTWLGVCIQTGLRGSHIHMALCQLAFSWLWPCLRKLRGIRWGCGGDDDPS